VRRLLTFVLLIAALSAVLVGLPTVTTATAKPRPVPASVERSRWPGRRRRAEGRWGAARPGPALLSAPAHHAALLLMGVTWAPDPALGPGEVLFRHRSGGLWSDGRAWRPTTDDAPDSGSVDTRGPSFRVGTAPIWTGPSEASRCA
jgi:hypothetical protein